MMSTDVDAIPGRRAAPWLAVGVGALVGAVWLYAGSELVLLLQSAEPAPGAAIEVPVLMPDNEAVRTETETSDELKNLVPAALAVLGTILVSVGLVFALGGPSRTEGTTRASAPITTGFPSAGPEDDSAPPAGSAPSKSTGLAAPTTPEDDSAPPAGSAPGPGEPDVAPSRRNGETFPSVPEAVNEPEGVPQRGAGEDSGARVALEAADEPEDALPVAALASEEPPAAEEPSPCDLIVAWDEYRRVGDGHFNRRGLQDVLDHRGGGATVRNGAEIDAGGAVLIVEVPSRKPHFYVLPSFNKSPRAVADWFDDASDRALTGRTQRMTRIARGRWVGPEAEAGANGRRFEVIERGEVA